MPGTPTVLTWLALCCEINAGAWFLPQLLLEPVGFEPAAEAQGQFAAPSPPLSTAPSAGKPNSVKAAFAEPFAVSEHTVELPKIAIIIDDLGDQWRAGERSAELVGDVTLALLPFSPYALSIAELAEQRGKELMLHAPMEPEAHHSWQHGLDLSMDEFTLRHELRLMLAELPMVKGVNNHMGSALTQRAGPMSWVMDELALRQLYFIDSRTSAGSQALQQAQRRALPSAKRDIFLDNQRTQQAIAVQFAKLLAKARLQGAAIAIAHPYPETLTFLESTLPLLAAEGVQLVRVSALLSPRALEVHKPALPAQLQSARNVKIPPPR